MITDEEIKLVGDVPGIYYFARNHGANSSPFYIGETMKLRSRLKQHLKTVRIADVLRGMRISGASEISNGPRSFHFAYLKPQRGQRSKAACQVGQKLMIRVAIDAKIPLLNSQLTVIKTHDVSFKSNSAGANFIEDDYEIEL